MLFSSLAWQALEMVLFFDKKGEIFYANVAAKEKLGYGEEIFQVHIGDIFPAAFEWSEDGFIIGHRFDTGIINITAYRKNQTCFPAEGKLVQGEDGRYICMANDILEKEFLNKEIAQVRNEAKLAMKVKTEFVANVTHELRTPVNGILGNVKELLEEEADEGKRKKLLLMERCCENMGMLINNILDFSKLEAGKFTLDPQRFRFRSMMDFIKESHERKITEKGLDFVVSLSGNIPEYVIADELRIGQILNNLLSNALKFTATGKICMEVIKTAQINDRIELFFIVSDTGIGIDKKDEDKLFQSFSQVDASISRTYGGTGLGLNICRQLVELMGGNISVESEKGKGSSFSFSVWVTIPEGESIPEEGWNGAAQTPVFEPERAGLAGRDPEEREDDSRQYGTDANKEALKKILSKFILSVEMDNWEKAEMFAETVRQLTNDAPREVKSAALRLKMSVQKENYEKTAAAFKMLKELIWLEKET